MALGLYTTKKGYFRHLTFIMGIQKVSVQLTFKDTGGKKTHFKTFLEADIGTKTFLVPDEGDNHSTSRPYSFFLSHLINFAPHTTELSSFKEKRRSPCKVSLLRNHLGSSGFLILILRIAVNFSG